MVDNRNILILFKKFHFYPNLGKNDPEMPKIGLLGFFEKFVMSFSWKLSYYLRSY